MGNTVKEGTAMIPIDQRTGKPREGRWVNRVWVADKQEPYTTPQSNPNFDPHSSRFSKGKVRHG